MVKTAELSFIYAGYDNDAGAAADDDDDDDTDDIDDHDDDGDLYSDLKKDRRREA